MISVRHMDSKTFEAHARAIVNSGLTSLALCLGNELGLVPCLCYNFQDDATIDEIAEHTGLKSRYVQEWLGCMVAADLVQVKTEDGVCRYNIPERYRRHVLLAAEEASAIKMLAKRQDRVRDCFSRSGPSGFCYSDVPETFAYITNTNRVAMVDCCTIDILPVVSDLRDLLEQGGHVADIGCGSGELITILATEFPNSTFLGVDNSSGAVNNAQALVSEKQLTNVSVEESNAHNLPTRWNKCFDWVLMCDVLHDLPNPQTALQGVRRVLKDDGVFSLLEMGISSHHENNVGDIAAAGVYAFSMYSCLPCSLYSNEYEKTNPGIGRENMEKLLTASGFKVERSKKYETDPIHVHMVCKKTNQEPVIDS